MTSITRKLVRMRESLRGQTMAEYTFILAAVAIAVFVTYGSFGSGSVLDGQRGRAGDPGCVLNRVCHGGGTVAAAKIRHISSRPSPGP
jgi:Flp pilus assembly pilin Flp